MRRTTHARETGGGADAWRNWAGNEVSHPVRTASPRSADELAATVREATEQGLRLKAVGTGHSFTGIAVTDGVLVRLDHLTGIVDADERSGLVTVLAGTPLHDLNLQLAERGLAMTNMGDIDRQTISGAISTGTHGTGAAFGGLADQVRGLDLVLADGSRVHCSATERPDLFAAARVGLGAMGVITAVTLQCVPAFVLHALERPMSLDDVLEQLDELAARHDHVEFYWFPHTRLTQVKTNDRMPAGTPPEPVGRVRGWIDEELLSNIVFEWTNRLTTRWPASVPRVNALAARSLAHREYSDASCRVFTAPRRVRFREMEYAVPRAALTGVLTAVDAWIRDSGERVSFPVEVRVAAADGAWLSTGYERENAYIAAHQYHRVPPERYFRAVEAIARDAGGRPHWGKIHYRDATSLRTVYPRFDDALAIRRDVDPTGTFTNAYLDRVLGPI